MVVYVPTDDGRGVRPQSVTLDSNKKTVKYALSVIFEEDARQKYPVFAKGTAVKGVTVKDGIATVDMNKAFVANDNGGELTAQLRLVAVVNTVTEFKDVKGVLFRIDGKPLTSFGAYDLSDPLSRMDNLIVK
ncbi:GerMN domain-containing protein [uncultured Veillonella sp.]|uniref:GerMN domain-containing protein n=1 Tax=uncultured Veillonella sp. TaxID=159268 RepID=UPI002585E460|nr:GerMN domain-containing protein [uncultured Veillonella sp.]